MKHPHLLLFVSVLCLGLALLLRSSAAQEPGRGLKLELKETSFGKRYNIVESQPLVFSPDGTRLAYWAWSPNHKQMFVAVNGVAGKFYDYPPTPINPHAGDMPPGKLVWSPDSQHLAYPALRGHSWLVVRDGKESKLYPDKGDLYASDFLDELLWSPDSQHLAYRVRRGQKSLVVLDGKEGRLYDWIADWDMHFSDDSERFAYRAQRGNTYYIVVRDGNQTTETRSTRPQNPGRSYHGTMPPPPTWRILRRDGKQVVTWNGHEGKPDDDTFSIVVSFGNQHIAYWAKRNGKWYIVVDDLESQAYRDGPRAKHFHDPSDFDDPRPDNALEPLVFDSSRSLHTLALREDGQIVRVEISLVEPDEEPSP